LLGLFYKGEFLEKKWIAFQTVSFGIQIANMESMHLIKRIATSIKNSRKYDGDFNQILRNLWESFFAANKSAQPREPKDDQ
jgi:hypothetical protein